MDNKTLLSRRKFISIFAAIAALHPISSLAKNSTNAFFTDDDKEPWRTLSAVQQHLFPKESSIGAIDIQALNYLHLAMQAPDMDVEEKKLIHSGVVWLNDLSLKQYSKNFNLLDLASKEKILRRIENSSAGERWLSTLLTYLLEALLADPVYGGNPNGVGWKWLQHQAGFPLPIENKKYYQLDRKRYRNTKA